jgi:hypothetical protein
LDAALNSAGVGNFARNFFNPGANNLSDEAYFSLDITKDKKKSNRVFFSLSCIINSSLSELFISVILGKIEELFFKRRE